MFEFNIKTITKKLTRGGKKTLEMKQVSTFIISFVNPDTLAKK